VADGQCLQTLTGHSGWVLACKFAPNGKTIVSASHDATLKIWDVSSGTCQATLEGHSDAVWACELAPNGKTSCLHPWTKPSRYGT
jgi:WD40 repeat protein